MNDLKTRVEETEEQGEGETQLVLSIAAAAALGGLGFWLYRRSQKTAPLTMLDQDQLAQLDQLPAPEEKEIILPQLTEEEIIRLAHLEEEEEEIHLAKLSLRERRRQGGGITIL